ncbi:MAG: PAS domain S-box protein [Zetaproteobacteria bacterium]|nr:MAG: PAS domain S-box protein [Zetaproteobacteria bacterium]
MDNDMAIVETAIQQSDHAVVIADASGVIRYVNKAFERLSGYSAAEAIGREMRLLKSGRHDAVFYRSLWETLAAGGVWRGIFVNRRKDGGLYEDETAISPVRNEAGETVGYLAVKRDVTVERHEEMQNRQRHTMDVVGRLAGGVAHDLNNALMTIMGHAEMLEYRLAETGTSSDEISEVKAACDRAASLTRQLLAFGGRQLRELTIVDVNRVVTALPKMLRRLLGDGIALDVVPSSHPALVRFEMGQIERILMTLAMRARASMPDGGRLAIAVDAAPPPSPTGEAPGTSRGWIEVRVTDSGAAIGEECRARIFEPFAFGWRQSWEEGLGLASAHEMIRHCGGRIDASGGTDGGSTFTISLPCVTPEHAEPAPSGRDAQTLRGTETILVAEDEDAVRDLVRVGLARLGYLVLDAPDGTAAMERAVCHSGPIDLLITDMVMPGMSGRELADRLVALQPRMKVIYMSGYPDAAHGEPAAGKPRDVFLRKPFTPEAVARIVRRALTGG